MILGETQHPMNSITKPTTLERIQRRLAESRFFAFSLLLHAALVIVASTIMLIRYNMVDDITPTGDWEVPTPVEKDNSFVDEKIKDPSVKFDGQPKPSNPEIVSREIFQSVAQMSPSAVVSVAIQNNFKQLPAIEIPVNMPLHGVIAKVPAAMAGRFKKDGRGYILGGNGSGGKGGTPITEPGVLRGLRWLRDHQNKDGSWGERNQGAMTGLALLSFLGHGELCDSAEFGYTVNLAMEWVISNGTKHQGRLSMTDNGWGGNGGVYEHGILTYALGEYYAMTKETPRKDERVLELFRKAIGYIVEGQGTDGGWMYNYDKTASDTSVSGWQVQALKAAYLCELKLPGVNEALDRSVKNFDRVQGPNGGYGYRGAEDRYSLTGVGALCKMFWGEKRDMNVKRAIEFIRVKTAGEHPFQYQHERGDLYAWYYHTQAMCMFGDTAWHEWDAKFSKEITGAQSPDGSWPVMRAPGHGNLQGEAAITGAVYRTTMSILMLETYYRYLPTNRAMISNDTSKLARL